MELWCHAVGSRLIWTDATGLTLGTLVIAGLFASHPSTLIVMYVTLSVSYAIAARRSSSKHPYCIFELRSIDFLQPPFTARLHDLLAEDIRPTTFDTRLSG
jgi:hypothetical protein